MATTITLKDLQIESTEIKNIYTTTTQSHTDETFDFSYLTILLNIAANNVECFPNINIRNNISFQSRELNIRTEKYKLATLYIQKWVEGYYNALNNLPSLKIASPKSSCSDPAIRLLVQTTQEIDLASAITEERYHNLFMSAENIQGALLEEYINLKCSPLGWIWCAGNTIRAVDFCYKDGSVFLQVKNKSNTENSSSSNIRSGTSIQKWYRLKSSRQNGQIKPVFCWDKLNQIIATTSNVPLDDKSWQLSEEEYEQFLKRVATSNKNILSDC